VIETLASVVRIVVAPLPLLIVVWGFVEWADKRRRPRTRGFRQYLIAAGLGIILVPAMCFAGTTLFPRSAPLGSWDNYLVASAWGRWNLPLSILALAMGAVGEGRGKRLLVANGAWLVMVWTMALVNWPGNT